MLDETIFFKRRHPSTLRKFKNPSSFEEGQTKVFNDPLGKNCLEDINRARTRLIQTRLI